MDDLEDEGQRITSPESKQDCRLKLAVLPLLSCHRISFPSSDMTTDH
jgi:hypothetical protein